jgi:hypothetical protein
MKSDKHFLEEMASLYPEGLDNLPPLEETPDVYSIKYIGKEGQSPAYIDNEYKTQEEAEKGLEKVQKWAFSAHIVKCKSLEEVMKRFYKDCLDDIRIGKKVWPINLP